MPEEVIGYNVVVDLNDDSHEQVLSGWFREFPEALQMYLHLYAVYGVGFRITFYGVKRTAYSPEQTKIIIDRTVGRRD